MAKLNVFTYENLSLYDSLIKQYVNTGDAKSIKKVTLDGRTLSFFKSEAEDAVADFVCTIPEQDLTALQTAIETNADAIEALEGRADSLETRATAVEGRTTTLEGTVNKLDGDASVAGSVKAQIAAAKTELEEKITASEYDDTEVRGLISANTTAVTKAQGEVDALETVVAGMYTNEAIDTAVADAKKAGTDAQSDVDALEEVVAGMYTNAQIDKAISDGDAVVKALVDANAEAIEAHKEAIDGKVTTLVGEDTGKSVRTIANEELAAQLIPEGAKESLDTLQEIAAWIQSHPDDASAMNQAITALQTLVGTLPEGITATTVVGYVAELVAAEEARATGVESGLNTRLEAVEAAVGEGGSVATQIDNKIAELDADVTSDAVENGKGIQVQVVEADGKITNVNVTGNFDNKYDALGSAEAAETNAKAHADGLNTAMDTRVTKLEGLVGDGYQAITESEINALFA